MNSADWMVPVVDPLIEFSLFADLAAETITRKSLPWSQIAPTLTINAPTFATKKNCPLIKLCEFGEQVTKTSKGGCYRHDENVIAVYGVEGDYDAGTMPMAAAVAALRAAGVAAAVYTTPSHSPSQPRWRVFCPLSAPVAPADRKQHVERLNAVLGGVLASESFVLSQSFYFGRVAATAADYESEIVEGLPIDLVTVPGAPAQQSSHEHPGQLLPIPDDIDKVLARLDIRGDYNEVWIPAVLGTLNSCGQAALPHLLKWLLPWYQASEKKEFKKYRDIPVQLENAARLDIQKHAKNSRKDKTKRATWENVRVLAGLPRVAIPPGMFKPTPGFEDLPEWQEPTPSRCMHPEGDDSQQQPAKRPLLPFPGIMTDIVNTALKFAHRRQPELMIGTTLLAMSVAPGSLYRLPNGTRANIYGVCMGGTGAGKEHLLGTAYSIVNAVGAEHIGRPASGEGLEDALVEKKGMLMAVDEIAHMFMAVNANKGASEVNLISVILQLFSRSSSSYTGRLKALVRGLPPMRKTINNPFLSILGLTTPEVLGKAFTGMDVKSGLIPRMLFFVGDPTVPLRRNKEAFVWPKHVQQAFAVFDLVKFGGSKAEDGRIEVEIPPEVDKLFDDLVEWVNLQSAEVNDLRRVLISRMAEIIERIVMVLAVWADPYFPIVTPEMFAWAKEVLEASNANFIWFIGQHMAPSVVIANAREVLRCCVQITAGKYGGTVSANQARMVEAKKVPWSLALRMSRLSSGDFEIAVNHLAQIGCVERGTYSFKNPHSGGTVPVGMLTVLQSQME